MNFSSTTSSAGGEADLVFGKRLHHLSPSGVAFLIFLIIFNIITFPITAVLNSLVMISVKAKSRLRAHKSNILLAFLALTDFTVGILVQPAFAALLIMLLLDEPRGYCVLQVLRCALIVLLNSSLFHLVLLSLERYIAMKHTFSYPSLVTEGRLLVASLLSWLFSVFQTVLLLVSKTVLLRSVMISTSLSLVVIFFCHFTVCRDIRRHEKRVAAQQTTPEAREQFERNKKAVKLTFIILAALLLCFTPVNVAKIVLLSYHGDITHITHEALVMFFCFSLSLSFFNSLLNPVIYALRMNQFRVAFIELVFRTDEEIEMPRFLRFRNSLVRVNTEQDKKYNKMSMQQQQS